MTKFGFFPPLLRELDKQANNVSEQRLVDVENQIEFDNFSQTL